MRITHVQVAPFEPAFAGNGYAMSVGRQTVLSGRLVRLVDADGQSGTGEIVRPPVYDPVELAALEDQHLPRLAGVDLADLPGLLAHWRGAGKLLQGLVFGVELAMLDLMGRKLGVPVWALLGGAAARSVPEYLSLSCEEPEVMADIVRRHSASFAVIQAKLGTGDLAQDLARVRAVLAVVRPDQSLLADFNGALTPDDAIRGLPEIDDPRLMWEEPCDDYDDTLAVAQSIRAPVMFDQCLADLSTCVRAIRDGAAAAMVIKSDSIGGLTIGRTVRDMCAAAGMRVRIDGWWAGQIAAAGALHLAIGATPATMMASIDLTDPIDTARDLIVKPAPGRVAPAPGAGLGATWLAESNWQRLA
ncbi:MAG: enolase C-terminal domain-like protein [Burkholderiaceae bacterium]